jgi:hypothetical protein
MRKIKARRYSKYRALWLEESEDESVLITTYLWSCNSQRIIPPYVSDGN